MKYKVIIEIDNHWLKILTISTQFKKAILKRFSYQLIENLSDEHIGKLIANFFKENQIEPAPLKVCLAHQQVTIRNLRLPSSNPQEIKSIIDLNIPRQVPYPKEDIVYVYKNLEIEETGYSKVILGIVHRNHLKRIFNILDRINLVPESIELSSEGIINWLLVSQEVLPRDTSTALILDVDTELTDLIIFSQDKLLFTRLLYWKREQLRDSSKRMQFLGDIKQSLVAFAKEEPTRSVRQLFLSGATEKLEGLDSFLSQELNLPIQTIENCRGVACDSSFKIPEAMSLSGIVGLGLETERQILSFQYPDWQIRKEIRKKKKELVALGSIAIYCIVAILGIFLLRLANRHIYLENLNKRLENKEAEYSQLTKMANALEVIHLRSDNQESILNYLYYLHQVLPEDIMLSEIIYSVNESLVLRGHAAEVNQIFKFVSVLDSSQRYQTVETKYTRKKVVQDQEVNEFEVVCRLTAK